MTDVTKMLQEMEGGNKEAADLLLPLVYDELRRLAHHYLQNERKGHSIPATGLVHDAYMKMVNANQTTRWENRRHFFAVAAKSMRNLLVDHARAGNRLKTGGGVMKIDIDTLQLGELPPPGDEMLMLDDAMRKLAEHKPRHAQLVELRFFGGMTAQEAAKILNVSIATAENDWRYARAWLRRELERGCETR